MNHNIERKGERSSRHGHHGHKHIVGDILDEELAVLGKVCNDGKVDGGAIQAVEGIDVLRVLLDERPQISRVVGHGRHVQEGHLRLLCVCLNTCEATPEERMKTNHTHGKVSTETEVGLLFCLLIPLLEYETKI